MQLGGRSDLTDPPDLAAALRAAAGVLGHRPAVTVLGPDGRAEQGVASLAQWAAKGAHLIELDLGLAPGDRLFVTGPPTWMPAAVCLAAWWAGITVTSDPDGAAAGVVHESCSGPPGLDLLWFGDAVDGSPVGRDATPAYPVEVQSFPDDPPAPKARADQIALVTPDGAWTQRELIARSRRWGDDGPLGLDGDPPVDVWVPAVVIRPLVVGRPTVVVRGVSRARAAGEKVSRWV